MPRAIRYALVAMTMRRRPGPSSQADHLLDGQPRCASDAKASQHDETGCEERDEPERRADELREPLGEGCRLLEQRFLFVTGGEALDGAGGCS